MSDGPSADWTRWREGDRAYVATEGRGGILRITPGGWARVALDDGREVGAPLEHLHPAAAGAVRRRRRAPRRTNKEDM